MTAHKQHSSKLWFHGHSGTVKVKELKKPSPSNPFFVAANVKYALEMASLEFDPEKEKHTSTQMRRKSQSDLEKSQVIEVKLDESKLRELDLKRDAKKLDGAYNGMFSRVVKLMSTGNGQRRAKMVNFDIIANIAKATYEWLKLCLFSSGLDDSFQNVMKLAKSGELAEGTYLSFADEKDFEEFAKSHISSALLSYGLRGYETFIEYAIAFMRRHGSPDEVDCRECLFKDIVEIAKCNAVRYIDSIESYSREWVNSEALVLFDISPIAGVKVLSYAEACNAAKK